MLNVARLSAAAVLVLAAQASQAVSYEVRQPLTGVRPVPEQEAPPLAAAALSLSAQELDFGAVPMGDAAAQWVTLSNIGQQSAALAFGQLAAPFSLAHDCPENLVGGASCALALRFTPQQPGPVATSLDISGAASAATLGLFGQGKALSAVGVLSADTSNDFGTVALGATAQRSFTFRNTGAAPATGVQAAVTAWTGLGMPFNSCGTPAAPITLASGAECGVTLTYGGSASGSLAGAALTVTGNFDSSPASLALTGMVGAFDAQAAWSTSWGSTVEPTAAALEFAPRTVGTYVEKVLYLRNVGSSGAIAVGLTLSGDVSQYKIQQVRRQHSGAAYTTWCLSGGGIADASVYPCLADDGAGGYSHIAVLVRYAPTVPGNHSLTLSPTTNNGTRVPDAITVTGSAGFNPQAEWSATPSATTALSAANLDFGVSSGAPVERTYYLRNVGAHGAASVGFALSGDTSQFAVVLIRKRSQDTPYSTYCSSGGGIEATSVSPCTADDVYGGGYPHIAVAVRYTPTTTGNHSLTLTPTSNNGTQLPGAVTVIGTRN